MTQATVHTAIRTATAKAGADATHILLPGMPDGLALPAGWQCGTAAEVCNVISPEGDVRLAFVAVDDTDAAAAAQRAWHHFDPAFDLTPVRVSPAAVSDGWDAASDVLYRTPAAASRVVQALVRCLRQRSYVVVIDASTAGFGRREAQIGALVSAWRPEGLQAESLAARACAGWLPEHADALQAFMQAGMRALDVPGAAMAIVQHGAVVYAQGFGEHGGDASGAVTADTPFMIGSTTKALTTLMMARLVATGALDWSTPVTQLLPDFALGDAELTRRLTLRHTVSASTGMPRRDLDLMFNALDTSAEQRLAQMREMAPTTAFGEVFQYSNYLVAAGGYAAARAVQASGALAPRYALAMQDLVFTPLGMRHTTVHQDVALGWDAARPHAYDATGAICAVDLAIERFAEAVAPAGAVWSSANDLARYLQLELAGGLSHAGERLLPAAVLQTRREVAIAIDADTHYGLGLIGEHLHGLPLFGHGGATLGFSSDLYFVPAHGLGVVVLTNHRTAQPLHAALRQKMCELLFDAKPAATAMLDAAVAARAQATNAMRTRIACDAPSNAWLASLVGHYHCVELGRLAICADGENYAAQLQGWRSALGTVREDDGNRLLAATSAPWAGTLRWQVQQDGEQLLLDAGQTRYLFTRRSDSA